MRQVYLDNVGDTTSVGVGMSIAFDVKLYPFELFGGGETSEE